MKVFFQPLITSPSKIICWLILLFFIWRVLHNCNYCGWHSPIIYDVASYYSYLPAFFIHHDLKLTFIDAHPEWWVGKFEPLQAPNGNHLIKMTLGVALYNVPFFLAAHLYALLFTGHDGFSSPYKLMLLLNTVLFTSTGLFFLRKNLLRFFSEATTFWVLLSIGVGTNLFYYTIQEPMSHAYEFFTYAIVIHLTFLWHEKQTVKRAIGLGFFLGMATLIRPTDGLIAIIPLFYGITSRDSLTWKLNLVKKNILQVIPCAIAFLLPLSLQMMYWKYVTGDWIFYSYIGEKFFWTDPKIFDGFFSWRKGLFIYTPIMIFGFLGIIFLKKYCREFFFPSVLYLIITIYIMFSWCSWWYGGSFGMRAMIDSYALLAFPMGAFFQEAMKVSWRKFALIIVVVLLIGLNQVQTYQYRYQIIHWEEMSRKAYWYVFLKLHLTDDERKKMETLLDPIYPEIRN